MKKTNKTQYAILGMLSIAPMSGYEIRQVMQQSTTHFWAESDGQLYPTLGKLHAQGLVDCKPVEGARGKKEYQITKAGMAELKEWLMQKPETHSVRNELMLKLFFATNINPGVSLERIYAHRYETKEKWAELVETKKQLELTHQDSQPFPYWLMTLQYGLCMTEAKLKWCDQVIEQLEKMHRGESL